MSQGDASYSAEAVQVLRDLEHIRARPGMYIGDTDVKGLHHLLFELIFNSVEEFSASPLNRVLVEFLQDGGCRVQDDGRGIPLDRYGPRPEVVLTTVCAPGWRKDARFLCEAGLHGANLTDRIQPVAHLLGR